MGLKFRKKIIFYMIEEIKQRLGFYRKMQLWPIANELDYENWLDNLIWADLVLYIYPLIPQHYSLILFISA